MQIGTMSVNFTECFVSLLIQSKDKQARDITGSYKTNKMM